MKLFVVSVGLLFAALGLFYVPVSFSVDGFGLVVNASGIRTIRAAESGRVQHFPSRDGNFSPGQIVTAVTQLDAVAQNSLLQSTLRRELVKIEADHLERSSKILVELERNRAKLGATQERLAARVLLTEDTATLLAELREYTLSSTTDIDDLNEKRLSQLTQLEDLLQRSAEVSALPAQRLAATLGDLQADRLSVITSTGTRFSSDRQILDMVKKLNDLSYSNVIDDAEVVILSDQLDSLSQQLLDLQTLREAMRTEAQTQYLAKIVMPQIAVSDGQSIDMRSLQASRADVSRGDALRLLSTPQAVSGMQLLIFGAPDSGEIGVRYGSKELTIALPASPELIASGLRGTGLDVVDVHTDNKTIGSVEVFSIFAEFGEGPDETLSVSTAQAQDGDGIPVRVFSSINRLQNGPAAATVSSSHQIVGFLENRYALVLSPGQNVRGAVSDVRTGSDIVFDAYLLNRDFSTVDTQELGIRLGNKSLASKIISRGVLSQVVVGVDAVSARKIENIPGAVVHLSFPLARQSLFSFLVARNAAI